MLLLTLTRQDSVQNICCWKTVLNNVWIRNRNQKLFQIVTETATNSTTLKPTSYFTTGLSHLRQYCKAAIEAS
jgi:hypothetical protein